MDKRFIESPTFPFSKISEASAVEKGLGRPHAGKRPSGRPENP